MIVQKKWKRKRQMVKGVMQKLYFSMGMLLTVSNPVMAAKNDASSVTAPLDALKGLVLAIIGAVGVIYLAKNIMEFAQAYQQADSTSMKSALKGIVGGVIMVGISTVLTLLGV